MGFSSEKPSSASTAPSGGRAAAARPWWRSVLAAQESGLVVVIALMMAFLTFAGSESWTAFRGWAQRAVPAVGERLPEGGAKSEPVIVEVPAGATAVERGERGLVVSGPGGERTYQSESGWRIRDQDDGSKVARGTRPANRFLDKANLVNVTTSASFTAIMAVGMTAIIILAGIDLSVGSIYALSAMLGAIALRATVGEDAPAVTAVPLALVVCCGVGALCGLLNGFSSVALRVHPFIITLGAMAIYRGLVFVITRGETISAPVSIQTGFFKATGLFGEAKAGGIAPVPTLIMLAVAGAGMLTLSRTVFGRRIYAIGGNETAARYAGIHVGGVKTLVYAISGLLAGLSACIYLGYYGAAETNAGQGAELNVIAAAVIGGASLSGGRGSAVGAVLGAVMVQLISNGMVILGIDQSYNQIVMGLAIVLAVVVDQAKARLTA